MNTEALETGLNYTMNFVSHKYWCLWTILLPMLDNEIPQPEHGMGHGLKAYQIRSFYVIDLKPSRPSDPNYIKLA